MTTDTLREAVARAMRRQSNVYHFDRSDESGWEDDLDQVDAALSAIEAAGWRIVPVEPTGEMLASVALRIQAPDSDDYVIAQSAIPHLPKTEHPDVADILADMSRDYRAMLSAAPRLDATVRSGEEG